MSGYEKIHLRGVDDDLRKLSEAFPEFYWALRNVTVVAECYAPGSDVSPAARVAIGEARAILARMRGDTPIAGKGK
jgi:hypothetical protein